MSKANAHAPAILARLNGVRKTSNGWEAKCPAHEDRTASLCIGIGDDGHTLVCCQAGCKTEQVVDAIGMKMADLMPPSNGRKSEIVATYDYHNENGVLLFQAVRRHPKGFFQRSPVEGGGWRNTIKGVRPVPYRLPELVKADTHQSVFIAEGEKDVDRLVQLGFVATCNAGGAEKWRSEFAAYLAGRQVVILPDNDGPGRKHAEKIARSLQGEAASVKVLPLPGLQDKGDVSDWLDAGGTRETLLELTNAAAEWEPSEKLAELVETTNFPLTDSGAAERFANQHRANARFCHPWGKWLAWDGRRWASDDTGEPDRLAKRTARSILEEAAGANDDDFKALMAFSRRCESMAGRTAILRLARSESGIPILPSDLDLHPWLFNCPNGTIDLETGKLRPHCRGDYLTQISPTEYRPEAKCPTWERFLSETFDGNGDLIGFVQRLFGYCLTGVVHDHVLPILHGVGCNGKSTMVNAIKHVLGDNYAIEAPPELLMMNRGQHPTELARLYGKRLVVAIETEEGRRLAESTVKQLTGGDSIACRRMREDWWEYQPTHKVLLACNHRPAVRGTDWAIWRRLKLIPFDNVVPPERVDKTLPEKLRGKAEGILAWCVRGSLDYQRDGLGDPEAVKTATAQYRSAEDQIGEFIVECCVGGSDTCAKAADLFQEYVEFSGDKRTSRKRFGQVLLERGFRKERVRGTIWWYEIGLTE